MMNQSNTSGCFCVHHPDVLTRGEITRCFDETRLTSLLSWNRRAVQYPSQMRLLSTSVLPVLAFTWLTQAVSFIDHPVNTSGHIPFVVNNTTYHTWVDVHISPSLTMLETPLVVLHGGPGLTHDYMLPLADLASTRPVVFYDQIGNGRSSRLDPSITCSIELYLNELENVLHHLEIENFDLLGHSWGGILAAEFGVQRQDHGLARLILSNSLPQNSLWMQSQAELLSTFPEEVQESMSVGFSDPERFRAGMDAFYAVHGCTLNPRPKLMDISFDYMFDDPTVAIQMNAVVESWSIVDRLKAISVPTLVINGAADISQDYVNQPFLDNIDGSVHMKFENSSHTPMWEERAHYMQVVGKFLGIN